MRFTYMNATSVAQQVAMIKKYPNLLLWYTGDEPDGTSDPLNATVISRDQILSEDAYRHPVSLVLNCQDYYWTDYTNGTDIVMQDTYMIGNNATFSNEWNTTCTPDFGVSRYIYIYTLARLADGAILYCIGLRLRQLQRKLLRHHNPNGRVC